MCDGKADYPQRIIEFESFSNEYLYANYPKTYQLIFNEDAAYVTSADEDFSCSLEDFKFTILDYRYQNDRIGYTQSEYYETYMED